MRKLNRAQRNTTQKRRAEKTETSTTEKHPREIATVDRPYIPLSGFRKSAADGHRFTLLPAD
jgi:hypothetical protein